MHVDRAMDSNRGDFNGYKYGFEMLRRVYISKRLGGRWFTYSIYIAITGAREWQHRGRTCEDGMIGSDLFMDHVRRRKFSTGNDGELYEPLDWKLH
jgi:hypothetical protein